MKKSKPHATAASSGASPSDQSNVVAWEYNPQAQALRVDLRQGAFFVLPYSHFAFAEFAREAEREKLRASFTTHDVRIFGRNLREVGLALQKLAVEWIREVPTRYLALAEKSTAFIEQIEVTEISEEV